jgi:Holliday junction resolvase RusA-like endonuclease
VIELIIPEPTPSLNPMLRQFWHLRHKDQKRWRWLVRAARLAAKYHPTEPLQKARVTITRHGKRILDRDNLYGGVKGLVDILVKEGILADDTPAHVELVVQQRVTKPPRTVVQIEAMPVEAA